MILDPLYYLLKLKRLSKARYEVARYRGELTLANALRAGVVVAFVILFFSFGEVWPISADSGGESILASAPYLIAGASLPPKITAESAYIVSPASGFVLYDKDSARELPPASTTKIATALVVMAHYDPEDVVQVHSDCTFREGESLMGLFPNERISVRNLLWGMLIASGSDAACVLAKHYGGGESGFVEEMGEVVAGLGLERTHFANPTGADAAFHYSTARELAVLAWKALDDPLLREIVGTKDANVASVDGRRWHQLEATNELLGVVPGILGVKTGYTPEAGEVFVFYFKRNEQELLGVVLGSEDRFGDTRALIDWILSSFIFPSSEISRIPQSGINSSRARSKFYYWVSPRRPSGLLLSLLNPLV